MLDCAFFYDLLRHLGIGFFAGVPDSLLKDFCAYLTDHASPDEHVIAANEGGAVGLASGYHLATGRTALVYMQNSGQGNAVNPLMSLCDPEVYGIPMVLLVGWRGEPGIHDEPQHVKQGRITAALFKAMEIPCAILSEDPAHAEEQVRQVVSMAGEHSGPVALLVRNGTFGKYRGTRCTASGGSIQREQAIAQVAGRLPEDAVIVSTTGHISRELYACRKNMQQGHGRDFLMVGAMGHALQVAQGIAMARPERPVYCFDGDGAVLMHLGAVAIAAQSECGNLKHIVFNNGAHGSVGGQPTVALAASLLKMAEACGCRTAGSVSSVEELEHAVDDLVGASGPAFLEIRVSVDARPDLERPDRSPGENKQALMDFLHESE